MTGAGGDRTTRSALSRAGGTCRVCLAEGAKLSLFAGEEDAKVYVKVMACSSVQIREEDGFPDSICTECYDMLDTAFEFKKKCETSDMKLRGFLTKDSLKIEEEEYNLEYPEAEGDAFDGDDYYDESKDYDVEEDVKNFDFDPELAFELPKKKLKRKWKSKKDAESTPPQKNLAKKKKILCPLKKRKIVSNSIATSLLEGKCVWDGLEWRFDTGKEESATPTATPKMTLAMIKKEKDEEISKRERKKARRKLLNSKRVKTVNLCDTCGQTFKSRYHLKYHIVLKHQDSASTIKCLDPNCKKLFKLDHYMIRHVKRCHTSKRDFVCNECGKQYAFISSLKQHMKSHSENLVWKQCNFCAQKYRTQKSVDIHIRSVHTGERPSKCSVCDAAFFHDDYLKEHMRLHTGETPFKCPICKRGYAQRGNMKSHMKQHRLSELDDNMKATMKPNYLKLLRDC